MPKIFKRMWNADHAADEDSDRDESTDESESETTSDEEDECTAKEISRLLYWVDYSFIWKWKQELHENKLLRSKTNIDSPRDTEKARAKCVKKITRRRTVLDQRMLENSVSLVSDLFKMHQLGSL